MTAPGGVEQGLIGAIHARRLPQALAELEAQTPEDDALIAAARACITRIASQSAGEQADLAAALRGAGVHAEPAPLNEALQFHAFELRVAPDALGDALHGVAQAGYGLGRSLPASALTALRRTGASVTLMRGGPRPARLSLRWRDEAEALLPGRLRPGPADFAMAPLPGFLWPGYLALRPVRLLIERFGGAPFADRAGYALPAANLGTPEALLEPLLRLAAPSPEDVLLDLGCGDGRALVAAAGLFGCRGVGVEHNPFLVGRAREAIAAAGVEDRARVVEGSSEAFEPGEATIAFLFHPVHLLAPMVARLRAAMAPGAWIISHEQAPLPPGLKPDRAIPLFAEDALTVANIWRAGGG